MSIGGPTGWGGGDLDAEERLRGWAAESKVRQGQQIVAGDEDLEIRPRRRMPPWVLWAAGITAAIVVAFLLFR
jgi:hypothetical protein